MFLRPNSEISRTVVRLKEKKKVIKSSDPANTRKVSIKATAAGIKTTQKMAEDPRFHSFTDNLNLSSSKNLVKALKSLRGN